MAEVTSINMKSRLINSISEFGYSHMFNNMEDGVFIIDECGYIVYLNNAYEKMMKVSIHTELGKSIFRTKNDDVILSAFREKRNVKGNLNYYIGSKQISVSASPMYMGNEFIGVIAIYTAEGFKNNQHAYNSVIELNVPQVNTQIKLSNFFNEIVGESQVIKEALYVAQKASLTSSTVLVRGESGTGKELVARAIHYNSNRADSPFVAVNCGAIPSTLLESELFGYEQGAFTGATRRKIGKFEQANGGTIFLDEIGDMPIDMQVKILRVLQEKEFERVGGIETVKCNVRIVAATHRNLESLVSRGSFREDLYYRLNVIPIYLPSLKERGDDIPLLINHFIGKMNSKLGKNINGLSKDAIEYLCRYDWPGNIRELENLIERLSALTDCEIIDTSDLPQYISNRYNVNDHNKEYTLVNMDNKGNIAKLEEYEKEIIRHALERYGSFNAAGKALGITHKTVALKARKYNIIEND